MLTECALVSSKQPEKLHRAVDVATEADRLIAEDVDIHFHVWSMNDCLELFAALQEKWPCDIELAARNGVENVFVIKKQDPEAEAALEVSLVHPNRLDS